MWRMKNDENDNENIPANIHAIAVHANGANGLSRLFYILLVLNEKSTDYQSLHNSSSSVNHQYVMLMLIKPEWMEIILKPDLTYVYFTDCGAVGYYYQAWKRVRGEKHEKDMTPLGGLWEKIKQNYKTVWIYNKVSIVTLRYKKDWQLLSWNAQQQNFNSSSCRRMKKTSP